MHILATKASLFKELGMPPVLSSCHCRNFEKASKKSGPINDSK
jgi:hypothetical protein